MALTLAEVEHIAALARLRLSDEEKARYREQLSAILDYMAMLRRLDTSAIEPTATVLPLRSGVVPARKAASGVALAPVQVSARGMDTKRLKEEFGKDIVFWGGGVDTQRVLPFGKPEEVVDEVKRRIDDLAPGGGFIFAAVHNIQAFIPPENIVAAFDTALEYGCY